VRVRIPKCTLCVPTGTIPIFPNKALQFRKTKELNLVFLIVRLHAVMYSNLTLRHAAICLLRFVDKNTQICGHQKTNLKEQTAVCRILSKIRCGCLRFKTEFTCSVCPHLKTEFTCRACKKEFHLTSSALENHV